MKLDPTALPALVAGTTSRAGAMAQNVLEVARYGGLETGEEPSPYVVVATEPVFRLRRYLADQDATDLGPPVLLVPPLMLATDVYDVSPSASAVTQLKGMGMDPWVVDFGSPEHEVGGRERDLADHVLAVDSAVTRVHRITGRDVHLSGYSQGGMFCYQTAALRRGRDLASLITYGSPVDTRGLIPFGLPEELVAKGAGLLLAGVFGERAVPSWMTKTGFRLLDPVKAARQQVEFLLALHDREALLPRERQRRFLQDDGWVAWPGPALADFMRQFVVHNRMLQGGFTINGQLVTLADIALPVLTFVGSVDEIAPPASVRAINRAAPNAEIYERTIKAGHFGLVVGSASARTTWPTVAAWTSWVEGRGELPPEVIPVPDEELAEQIAPGLGTRLTHGLGLAAEVGAGTVRAGAQTITRAGAMVRDVSEEAVLNWPRLTRLERVRPSTRISLSLLLDERAERAPGSDLFLFEDRAHSHAAAKHRIDSVVRGLLSLGVRQGEHVGVLMAMRPTALVLVAALNRLGAVGVLMRPDGPVEREAALGRITRVVCDPEHVDIARGLDTQVLVLGGGAEERSLGEDVVDMERIDPDAVALPSWYRPNPGRARDLAFLLFTGEGDRARVNRITNRRWALSAFGTATAGSLGDGDTVYTVTPIYHPSALLVSLGGAIAGGSRIAMAAEFDPGTFWQEVRRYGVTVASYTWTMLGELTDAEVQPGERHHPVRLWVGSGMPAGLWREVSRRFAPAKVLEFYASPQGEAILVNLTGEKPGCLGRPLPGSAEVQIARWDLEGRKLETGADGFAQATERGEIGMLLARVRPGTLAAGDSPLRGVFSRDDAWVSTGDLFRQDADGDFWMLDPVGALVRVSNRLVAPSRARDALEDTDAVDLAVAYGLRRPRRADDLLVAALTLRPGASLTAEDLTVAFAPLDPAARPAVVRVLDELPVTTWYRPRVDVLRREGVPRPKRGAAVYARGRSASTYKRLTVASWERLGLTGEETA